MFGIMAIATMATHALNMFSDLGLRQSIVQNKQGNSAQFLNTAWITQILRGLLIFFGCLAISLVLHAANGIEWFSRDSTFAEPLLPLVLAAIACNAIIAGFESTKLLTASRNLTLGRLTAIDLVSQVGGLVFMIAYALFSQTIWALVIGGFVAALARTILSHVALPGPSNRFQWHQKSFSEIFHFGKWIFASSILGALLGAGDRLLLGGLVSAEVLGFYSIAFLIVNTIRTMVQKVLAFVVYPALSETARLRPSDLSMHYYKFRVPIDLASLFLLGFLYVSGEELIEFLYDSRYKVAGHHLAILAWSLFSIRFGVATQFYLAIGKPALLTILTISGVVGLFTSVPFAFHFYGLTGALWAIALSPMLSLPLIFYFNHKHGLLNLRKEAAVLGGLVLGIATGMLFDAFYANHLRS